jgi:hypothetical protein
MYFISAADILLVSLALTVPSFAAI